MKQTATPPVARPGVRKQRAPLRFLTPIAIPYFSEASMARRHGGNEDAMLPIDGMHRDRAAEIGWRLLYAWDTRHIVPFGGEVEAELGNSGYRVRRAVLRGMLRALRLAWEATCQGNEVHALEAMRLSDAHFFEATRGWRAEIGDVLRRSANRRRSSGAVATLNSRRDDVARRDAAVLKALAAGELNQREVGRALEPPIGARQVRNIRSRLLADIAAQREDVLGIAKKWGVPADVVLHFAKLIPDER